MCGCQIHGNFSLLRPQSSRDRALLRCLQDEQTGLGQTQQFVGSRKGTTDSEKDIFGENGRWECHWHGVIAWVEDDSTWAKHPKDQGMVQRMRGEPNIGTWVCVKENEVMVLIWLCVEEVIADVVTLLKRMSRFLDGGGLSPP